MGVLVDAQTVIYYYRETVLELPPNNYTALATGAINKISRDNPLYFDEGGQILQDWSNGLREEWLKVWYEELLIQDKAILVEVDSCQDLRRRLTQLGFPINSRDFWYVKTARKVVQLTQRAFLVTEDLDFHEPRRKGCSSIERERILIDETGSVAKLLRRNENIHVKCIRNFIDNPSDP